MVIWKPLNNGQRAISTMTQASAGRRAGRLPPSRREPLPASSRTKSGRTFDQAAAQRGKGLLVSEPAGRLYRLARPLVPRAELDEPSQAGVQLLSGMLARGSAAQFRQVSTDKSVRARYHRPWMRPVVGANSWMRQPILRTIHSFPCRLGIPVLRSLSPMKVALRRAPATPCSIRRSDHDNRRH